MTTEPDRPVPHRAPRNNLAGSFGRQPAGEGLSRLGPPRVVAPVIDVAPDPEPPAVIDIRDESGPTSVPWQEVAINPLNDRDPEDYTDLSDLTSMKTQGQLQACGIVTVQAFHRLFPLGDPDDEYRAAAEAVVGYKYVVVIGSRRRTAVEAFGLDRLKVDLDENLARSRADFLATVGAENLDRRNPSLLQEARTVYRLARELDSGTKAGELLGKSRAWVSQRRKILQLVPELLELVRQKQIVIEDARHLGGLDPEDQLAAWKQIQDKRSRKARDLLTAVNTENGDTAPEGKPVKARSWRFTEKQTPQEISGLLLERFEGQDLDALIELLTAARR